MTDFLTKLEEQKKIRRAGISRTCVGGFLSNHADEIAELVRLAQKVTANVVDAGNLHFNAEDLVALKHCVAALNKDKP